MRWNGWSTATADKLTLLHDYPLSNNSNITVTKRGTAIIVHENKLCLKEIKLLLLLLLLL